MSLFKKIEYSANDIRILKCVRWRDRTEQEIRKKISELYPPCLIMVDKSGETGTTKEKSWVVRYREFNVSADIKNTASKGFIGARKREDQDGLIDDEFFITKEGLYVLADFTVVDLKKKE